MNSKWKPAKTNNGWWMARCIDLVTTDSTEKYSAVECRQMYWWERIRYFRLWRAERGR
jgi:hypothetical protein